MLRKRNYAIGHFTLGNNVPIIGVQLAPDYPSALKFRAVGPIHIVRMEFIPSTSDTIHTH